ncbi:formate dehydrogenase [Piscinibacter aquaticus]|uniref:Formate dehydrogenase n=1 Tax=Piscinibacter aquaticus TaxID=392597 RepID=A0A5C6TY94_9BURK|nr:formate dehydrogenase [Piscinibacter aquaticus]
MKKPSTPALSRRTVFAGAGAVGALAAAAAVVPAAREATVAAAPADKPEQAGGYRLSEHVKQYYASARH